MTAPDNKKVPTQVSLATLEKDIDVSCRQIRQRSVVVIWIATVVLVFSFALGAKATSTAASLIVASSLLSVLLVRLVELRKWRFFRSPAHHLENVMQVVLGTHAWERYFAQTIADLRDWSEQAVERGLGGERAARAPQRDRTDGQRAARTG